MKITFESTTVQTRNGTSKRTGQPYAIRTQEGIAESKRYRMPVKITLADAQAAYPVGTYDIDTENALQVGRFGEIEVSRHLPLIPARKA